MNGEKGSLTVEATISVTVFLFLMIALLMVVKMVIIEYVLSYCAFESAKAISDSSYLVTMINTLQEEADDTLALSLEDAVEESWDTYSTTTVQPTLSKLLGYETGEKKASDDASFRVQLTKIGVQTWISFAKQIGTDFYGFFRDDIESFKNEKKYDYVKELINQTIDEKGIPIDTSKLHLEIVKFPETTREYVMHSVGVNYIKNGLAAGSDFDKDDAVVVISYEAELNIPLINQFKFNIRKIAIEKCWTNGDNGTITKFDETGLLSQGISALLDASVDALSNNYVYVLNNSSKYHTSRVCGKIGDSQVTEMFESTAKNQGYTACSSCGG